MNKTAEATIVKYKMLSSGDSVIVALSGGADSAALLHFLNSIKEKYDLRLYIAHLNHGLRGEEAKRDEDFCLALAEKYGVKAFVEHKDIRAAAKEKKISEELCGRVERYAWFEELSKKLNAKIATAHTASDNAETLIFNITRGASVSGISAIPPVRGNIIRPLIAVTREQVERYCADNSLEYVTDSTNLSDDYTRNRLRHGVIPQLKEINPQLERALTQLSESAVRVCDYMNSASDKAIAAARLKHGYDCSLLSKNDEAVLNFAIVGLCKKYADLTPDYRQIGLLRSIIKEGGALDLSGEQRAIAKQGVFRIVSVSEDEGDFSIPFAEQMSFNFKGKTFKVTKNNSDKENKNSVNISVLENKPIFRTRAAKDKFTFAHRNITKPLRKALNEKKIPEEKRDSLLVLASGSTVLWCEELGASKQGIGENPKELLCIEAEKEYE